MLSHRSESALLRRQPSSIPSTWRRRSKKCHCWQQCLGALRPAEAPRCEAAPAGLGLLHRGCGGREAAGARSPAAGAEGEGLWLPLLLESASLPLGTFHPAAPGKCTPSTPLRASAFGTGKASACPRHRNIQPFVSLDEVRYSAEGHENRYAKWLPRPPPIPRGGGLAPRPHRAPGRAGAGRPRREAVCLRQGGRGNRTAAPRSWKTRNAPVPLRTSPAVRAGWSTL